MKWKLVKEDSAHTDYIYCEEFEDLYEAQYLMHQMYKNNVINNVANVDNAAHFEMSAYIQLDNGNELTWKIEPIK